MKKADRYGRPVQSNCTLNDSLVSRRVLQYSVMSKQVKRLYDEFQPTNYRLSLAPDRDKATFSGSVVISGKKTGKPSKRLTFHQKGLKITSAKMIKHDKTGPKELNVDRINNHEKFDEVRLHSQSMIYPGNYTVELEFKGKITSQMNGMYPCEFKLDGKDKSLIATQFESHHAREVFPCIDEPESKATFDLTLTTPQSETVLANTPIAKQDKKDGQAITTFEETPVMSTYLLAFAYGEMGFKEAKTKQEVTVRTFATPDKVNQTDFALDIAVKCLEFYSEYFAIDYPLEKLDMIALPDFASGAMENWGLVTYREQCMLVDPENTSVGTKQYVAMVVAHELAHQWFGNLVTMRWWTDLWLNEGFASWIEYLAVDHIFPEWQMWTQFIADEQQMALRLDALENTHPIEVPVHHPDEIRTIFDAISYSKGASVIHMLNNYLGKDIFRDGLRHYLKEHAYKNTDTIDLWASLAKVSGKPVEKFMHAWTSQSGFPIVIADLSSDKPSLKQERFYLSLPEHKSGHKWPVPTLASGLNTEEFDTTTISLDTKKVDSELIINSGRSGFYRVAYDSKHLNNLSKKVVAGSLEPIDRMGLLSDSFESAKAGYLSTVSALELLANFQNESNAAVWDCLSAAIGDVRSVMGSDDAIREAMKPMIAKLASKQLKRLGWKPKAKEEYFDTLLRPTVLGLSASSDVPDVITEIDELFAKMKKTSNIDPDIRSVVWNTVARRGSKKEFTKFVNWHNTEDSSEIRTTLAAAITGFKQPELVQEALEMVKTSTVRNQDAGYWIAYGLMNRFGRDIAWKWMRDNWAWLENNLGSDLSFYRFPVYAARVFTGEKYLKEFKKFFEPKKSPALERSIKQGIEMIEWHTAWYDRDHKEVLKYLKSQK